MLNKLAKSCQKSDSYTEKKRVMYMLSAFLLFAFHLMRSAIKSQLCILQPLLKALSLSLLILLPVSAYEA